MTIKEIRKQYLTVTGKKAPESSYTMWLEMLVVEKSKVSEEWRNRAIKIDRKVQEQSKEIANLKGLFSQIDGVEYDKGEGVLVFKNSELIKGKRV